MSLDREAFDLLMRVLEWECEQMSGKVLLIEGEEHAVPGRRRCDCEAFARECPECGGFMHFEAPRAGSIYQCEDCGHTR